jgi:ABC-type Co2+ transport system permease subunit
MLIGIKAQRLACAANRQLRKAKFQRASASDRIRLVDLLGALLIARLLLSLLVAHNALIGTVGRLGLGPWHALLAAMLAALILYTFQIVFFGHRNRTLSFRLGGFEVAAGFLTPVNAIPGR